MTLPLLLIDEAAVDRRLIQMEAPRESVCVATLEWSHEEKEPFDCM